MSEEHLSRLSRRALLKFGGAAFAGLSAYSMGLRLAGAQEEQVLKVAHPVFTMDWSPLRGGGHHFRWNSLWWAAPMYFDAESELQPYVFASWEPSEDAKTWTFKIADGAKFSDGSPITSADVKGSWELAAMPASKSQRVAQLLSGVEGYDAVVGGSASEIPGIATPDEGTVVVTLTAPDPVFHMRIANHIAPIVKASEARDESGNEVLDWYMPENGGSVSGPFKMTSVDLDAGTLVFEPNENFFGPAPKLTRVDITTVEDAVAATALLQAGDYNAHTELVTSTIIQDLGTEFSAGPIIPTGQHFWLNTSRAPFDDPKVREALILAVDRDGLFQATFPDGPHKKADQIIFPVPGSDDSGFEPYPYDPERAKQLLAESSYGGPERLPKILIAGISSPARAVAGQYIAEQWRQNLGITAVEMKPSQDDFGPEGSQVQVMRDDVGTRVPDAVAYLAGAIASSSSTATNKLGGYKNEKVDALLEEAATLPADDPERIAKAQEAQRLFREDYCFIPWYHEAMSRWALPSVKNIDKNLDWQVATPWAVEIG
ncbi:ABC transporter substrate-binding protein [Chelativorans xinjiangense]|uniref:ABC transporter substrate-binding protein n=1 Tax=Chelativorans xinjiangense TaxID=2681485 RepID=UPI0013594F54|nr:ABC transporter substrate-binding protein [Chelativorans xinjiangense]